MKQRPPLNDEQQAQHPHLRRYTRKYGQKKRIVRDVWIVSGLLMISLPLSMIAVLALGTTFVAFTILDETP